MPPTAAPLPYSSRKSTLNRNPKPMHQFNIPTFNGSSDPTIYLDWEDWVELLFQYRKIPDSEKVSLATNAFTDYALSWWKSFLKNQTRNNEYPIAY